MPAATVDLKIEQGSTFSVDLVLKNDAGDLIDLTGWTGKCQMRKSPESTEKYDINVMISDEPETGALRLYLTDEETSAIVCSPSRTYKPKSTFFGYDVELTDPDGNVQRILQGSVEVVPEVTR